ncbi:hypothetical protein [Pedobacter nototheniae]|uniref:hypothetical protein n=1 Tax=Pedobacter nototheniae TaxID=2488994 RepID=UPI0013F4A10E|nr:hypothetical protein [Pedobacter nototheniae]
MKAIYSFTYLRVQRTLFILIRDAYGTSRTAASCSIVAPAFSIVAPAFSIVAPAFGIVAPAFGIVAPAFGIVAKLFEMLAFSAHLVLLIKQDFQIMKAIYSFTYLLVQRTLFIFNLRCLQNISNSWVLPSPS